MKKNIIFSMIKQNLYITIIGLYVLYSVVDYWLRIRLVHAEQILWTGGYGREQILAFCLHRKYIYPVCAILFMGAIILLCRRSQVRYKALMNKVFCISLILIANFRFCGDLLNKNILHPVQYHLLNSIPSYVILLIYCYICKCILWEKHDIQTSIRKILEFTFLKKCAFLFFSHIIYLYICLYGFILGMLLFLPASSARNLSWNIIHFASLIFTDISYGKILVISFFIVVNIAYIMVGYFILSKLRTSIEKGIAFGSKCFKYFTLFFIDVKLAEIMIVEQTPLFINLDWGNALPTYLLLRFCIISMYKQIALRNNGGE